MNKITTGFYFECTQCANCCTGDQSVILTLHDLWKMGRFLKLGSTRQLFKQGYLKLIKHQNNCYLPQIVFKEKPWKFCPFLINEMNDDGRLTGGCSLHPDYKPLVCRLAPVGRVVDLAADKIDYVFTPPAVDCPGMESQKWNDLNDHLDGIEKELNYQTQFFKILDRIYQNNFTLQEMIDQVYSINVHDEYSEILIRLQNQFISSKPAC